MKPLIFFLLGVTVVWSMAAVSGADSFKATSAQANILDNLFNRQSTPTPPPTIPSYESTDKHEEAIVRAVERAAPAVVSVIVTKDLPVIENCPINPFADLPPQFREFFGPFEIQGQCERGTRKQEVGGGSGFIVSEDGLVLTNKHVVADLNAEYTVLTNEGKKYNARVIARDPVQDLAVVRIISPQGKLPMLSLGDSEGIKLGQTAIAIGNALGEFRNTVSVGIISGLARTVTAEGGGTSETLEGVIQTDAAINPGNSGGPLLNLKGEVIGINTAVAIGAENIGFAIPVNKARRDLESVKKTGTIQAPYLGVRYILITEEIAERENLKTTEGVLVRGSEDGPAVIPGSPAEKAGIIAEDIITKVDGETITRERSLASLIQKRNVGDTITLSILRKGKSLSLKALLKERPEE